MPDCKIVLVSFGKYLVHMRTLNITDVSCMHILLLNALDVAALDLSTGAIQFTANTKWRNPYESSRSEE